MLNSLHLQKKSKGAAMVEFAIVLPLLLIIMLGVLFVSLLLIQDNTLNKSVRESSRYLARNLGLQGCYTNIAEAVVSENMNNLNLFASGYADVANCTNPAFDFTPETICVNDNTGAISNPIEITDASCASIDPSCASGTHLHIRVTAICGARTLIPGVMGFSFTPRLSATSIMRVQ